MRNIKTVAPLLPLVAFAACQTAEPVRLTSSIQTSPLLNEVSPADIAVLPIEDATPERGFEQYAETLRQEIAKSLVHKLYSPLSMRLVDSELTRARGPEPVGSVVEASFLVDVAGKFEEDALLGVRVVRWSVAGIMNNARVTIGVDVAMFSSDGHKILWSGHLEGDVRAGGNGPAPLARNARINSAIEVFADALIRELPSRRT